MRVSQLVLNSDQIDGANLTELTGIKPQLVLAFGSVEMLQGAALMLAQAFPVAHRIGCSTAGEISASGVSDNTLVLTALALEHSRVEQVSTTLAKMEDSFDAGVRLASALPRDGLRAILVFGQGVHINGSAMLEGLSEVVGTQVPIMGGLAGDGGAFAQTWVLDDAGVSSDHLVCVGLYGAKLSISHGSYGGWSPFGPARKVTRCRNNVLLELDGQPALSVYKRYLGEHAKGLPASGLLFPFAMLTSDHSEMGQIRTILGVDEVEGSLTLAGDIEPNGYLRLMHASTDALVDGAQTAAQSAKNMHSAPGNGLALLVSCVGRKLVMGGRVDEEVEAVGEVFGQGATLAGFYSYGEISPTGFVSECKLHNQTMTITYLTEAA
jgi:hypothetical protein